MTDLSPNIQSSGEGSSTFLERYIIDSSDTGGFDGDDSTDLNLDKTLLNEDPLAEDDPDAQSVIAAQIDHDENDTQADEIEDILQAEAKTSLGLIAA